MDKVAELVPPGQDPAFFPKPSCPFYSPEANPGHYALNQPSPYGEEFLCLLSYMAKHGGNFESGTGFADELEAWAQGTKGRLNHCSKQFLENRSQHKPYPQGAEKDAQMNSVVKAVLMAARYAGDPLLLSKTEECIRVHQNDDVAVQYGLLAAKALERVILDVPTALPASEEDEYAQKYQHLAPHDFLEQLARDRGISPPMYASSCGLPHAYTTCLYFLLQQQHGAQDLIRENIRFGGDNCSRAVFLGAIKGAGQGFPPPEWTSRVANMDEIAKQIDVVMQARDRKL